MNRDEKFHYTYSAPNERERREIESIKKQYTATHGEEDKLETLRRLNKRVMQPPMLTAAAIGIVGILILGMGMTMVLEWKIPVWGVAVGILGAAIAAVAYPVYRVFLKRNKKKYGRQIIELSDELLNREEGE